MDRAARIRWAVLLTALGLTVAAIVHPLDESEYRPARTKAPSVATDLMADGVGLGGGAEQGMDDMAEADDPFAPRAWLAPTPSPPPPPTAAQQLAVAPAAPPVLAGPPPLPYKFMGRFDGDGIDIVYISRGDQAFVARSGETLEGSYKIASIDRLAIEFEYLPSGEKQRLVIPAPE